MAEKKPIIVRDIQTREPVGEPIMCEPHNLDRVMAGLLRRIDTERFFADDSAFDA